MTLDPTTPFSPMARAVEPTMIRQLRAQAGPDSLDFGLGQPDLPVAEPVRRALVAAVQDGRAPYTENRGLPATRQAVADRYGVGADQVMITCGVQEGLAVSILGLVEPGDEVLVPDPGFPAYPNLVRMAGAKPVAYRLDAAADFGLAPAAVEAAMSDKTSAIVLNTPSNPTGAIHRRADLEAVIEACRRRNIGWICDEIYEDYVYQGDHVGVLEMAGGIDGGVKLGGLSKSHHMMGWRVGWMVGPAEWIDRLEPLHQHLVTCAPTPAQRAAQVALADHRSLVEPTVDIFARRRRRACRGAAGLDGVDVVEPAGAFYLFLDVRAYTQPGRLGDDRTSVGLARALLDRYDVVTIPGAGFGPAGEGFLRLAYTVDDTVIDEGMERMGQFFDDLGPAGSY